MDRYWRQERIERYSPSGSDSKIRLLTGLTSGLVRSPAWTALILLRMPRPRFAIWSTQPKKGNRKQSGPFRPRAISYTPLTAFLKIAALCRVSDRAQPSPDTPSTPVAKWREGHGPDIYRR